ncbi:MAG TPA: glycerate kinase [Chloroflexota bacterium]
MTSQPPPPDLRASKALALDLIHAALEAVEPAAAVRRHVRREGQILFVGEKTFDLSEVEHIYVVGAGKASAPMAVAIEEILGDRITDGVVNVKYGHTAPTTRIRINQAGHPIPDDKSVQGAREILDLAGRAGPRDLVICLISGGASALMVAPVDGVTLADKRRLTDALLRSGATINEMNAVRKHLSLVKGGNLVRAAQPAEVVSLVMSDVVGSPLDTIGSGPTVPDTSTYAEALAAFETHAIEDRVPPAIRDILTRGAAGELPETPKPGDPLFARTHNLVVASNEIAARALMRRAVARGLNSLVLSTFIEGEAREVGIVLAAIAREIATTGQPLARPACLVTSGETTVTVRGRGRGGRAQELALAAVPRIAGLRDTLVVGFSTDGVDGPTDAAGAIAHGVSAQRARQLGLDPAHYLADNDSFHFFEQLGDLIVTGPTNTNVADMMFVLVL